MCLCVLPSVFFLVIDIMTVEDSMLMLELPVMEEEVAIFLIFYQDSNNFLHQAHPVEANQVLL